MTLVLGIVSAARYVQDEVRAAGEEMVNAAHYYVIRAVGIGVIRKFEKLSANNEQNSEESKVD